MKGVLFCFCLIAIAVFASSTPDPIREANLERDGALGAAIPSSLRGVPLVHEPANRPLIREQAFGESLDPDKLERLARYEVHLDRKLERSLAMLFRLKELRTVVVES